MKLAIVGSRVLIGNQLVFEKIHTALAKIAPSLLISGGAIGVDSMAAEAAIKIGIPIKIFPPWALPAGCPKTKQNYWQFCYKPRDEEIADACDMLICLTSSQATTFGARWTKNYAQSLGKITKEYIT